MADQAFTWYGFANLGGIAGIASLVLQAVSAARNRQKRPKLHAKAFDSERDLRTWVIGDGPVVQKVLTVEITNVGKRLADRCAARATVLRGPDGVAIPKASAPLKWAGTEPSGRDTGASPVDIGSEDQRLDIVFARNTQTSGGCWLAAPLALARIDGAPQFYLPPGQYEIEVVVDCVDGDGCGARFSVKSPNVWDQLEATRLS